MSLDSLALLGSMNSSILNDMYGSITSRRTETIEEGVDDDDDDDNIVIPSKEVALDNAPPPQDAGSLQRSSLAHHQQQQHHHPHKHHDHRTIADEGFLLKDELLAMISLAIPVIATYLLEVIPSIITIVLVGRMKNGSDEDAIDDNYKLHLDAAALAVMYFNIVGMATGLGLLTALDTLCASAHGAKQPMKMGQYLLTSIFIMVIMLCVVGMILYHTTHALVFFGLSPALASNAGIFVGYMLPGLPFIYAYEALRKLSQARNETTPMVLAAVMSVLVNAVSGYYLVNYTSLGWLGAAVARTVGNMIMFPIVFVGMYHTDREFLSHVWAGFQVKEAITKQAISKFLNLGVPGMLQLVFEWGAFEIIALLCGILPNDEEAEIAVGTNAIVTQINSLLFMFYLGTSVSGNIRIGNALGAGDVHRAKFAFYLSLALGILLSLVSILCIVWYRETLPYFFTTDEDLIGNATDLLLVFALFQFPDSVNCVEQGVFKAIGKQTLAAKLNFTAYYVVGIPLAYVLGLTLGLGVEGLWLGITVGLFWGSIVNSIILFPSDWKQLSLDAQRRLSIVHTRELVGE
jgi:MATE family multidrug resistance protein